MKYLLFAAVLLSSVALGQDSVTVRASTRILADGSRATTITDPDQQTATETITDAGGKVMRKTLFTLDATGATTGAIHYDNKGNIRYKESYKRDVTGKIASSYLYSKDDRLLGYRSFVYDSKGNTVQIDDYDAAGKLIPKKGTSGRKRGR